jgi:hypothetical protein
VTEQGGSYRRVRAAAEELKGAILEKYPDARFRLARAADEWRSWNLWAMVDVDDLDEVGDLVSERTLDMRVEEGIPIHVVPIRDRHSSVEPLPTDIRRTG